MSVKTRPLRAEDIPELEMFSAQYSAGLLGQPGRWRGAVFEALGLDRTIRLDALENLLRGRSPTGVNPVGTTPRPHGAPVGWSLTFTVDPQHAAVWAIGSREQRSLIESSHSAAVAATLQRLDHRIRQPSKEYPYGQPGALYAQFSAGATTDGLPSLRTVVIIPNGHVTENGQAVPLPGATALAERLPLTGTYLSEYMARTAGTLGRLGEKSKSSLPGNLFDPIGSSGAGVSVPGGCFDRWRAQAAGRGFDSTRLNEILRESVHQSGLDTESKMDLVATRFRKLGESLWTSGHKLERAAPAPHRPSEEMSHDH